MTLTLLGTIVLVVLVIFLFLRRFVATVIPTLSLPVSLVGAVALLWALRLQLDNISLLGLTLAVGLVVDDAIVMLENIMRHVENGEPPFQAALRGSREVGFTIISISISLVAVFIPIFFMPGVIGLLFHEFAVVVGAGDRRLGVRLADAGADAGEPLPDATSAHEKRTRAAHRAAPSSAASTRVLGGYTRTLDWRCATASIVLVVALATFVATGVAVHHDPQGLLPGGGHRPDHGHDRGRRGHLVPGDGAAAGPRRRRSARRPDRGDRQLVQRRAAARRTPAACSST